MANRCIMKQVLEIPLAELATVRLSCKQEGCNGTIQASLTSLEEKSLLCPVCKTEFRRVLGSEGLNQLVAGFRNLQHANVPFKLDFIVTNSEKEV